MLLMVFIIGIAVSAWLLSVFGGGLTNTRNTADRQHNARVLNLAKQALIGWVVQQAVTDDNPGRLPCPEAAANISTNPGIAAPNCAGALPAVGRLPWKTLGIDQLTDASGEPLWYVVSPGWKLPSSTGSIVLNSNTAGQLTLDAGATGYVALIIAPGSPLKVQASANCTARQQNRAAPAPGMDYRDYLECQNAASPIGTALAATGPSDSFNDLVLPVSPMDVWRLVEGAVAARLSNEVIPALRTAFDAPYVSAAQWGSGVSAAAPMLPFALSFAGGSTQPSQGALPLWRSQGCTSGTDPYCDPTFVHWAIDDADQVTYPNPNVVQRNSGSNAATLSGSTTCSSSTASQVTCTVNYSRTCGGFLSIGYILGGTCNVDMEVSVLARVQNIGRSLRTFSPSGIAVSGGTWSLVSSATPIDVAGTASADIRLQLPTASCTMPIIFGLLFPCTASKSVTVTVPITIFPDDAGLTAFFTSCTTCQWFINNQWYDLMYYAVAPSHTPQGSPHDCRPGCLTVDGGTFIPSNGGLRAVVGLTGYSLTAQSRPNTSLADYLDSVENLDGNAAFEQRTASRSFNDRFFAVSYY